MAIQEGPFMRIKAVLPEHIRVTNSIDLNLVFPSGRSDMGACNNSFPVCFSGSSQIVDYALRLTKSNASFVPFDPVQCQDVPGETFQDIENSTEDLITRNLDPQTYYNAFEDGADQVGQGVCSGSNPRTLEIDIFLASAEDKCCDSSGELKFEISENTTITLAERFDSPIRMNVKGQLFELVEIRQVETQPFIEINESIWKKVRQ